MTRNQVCILKCSNTPISYISEVERGSVLPPACRVPGRQYALVNGYYYRVEFTYTVSFTRKFLREYRLGLEGGEGGDA